MAWFHGGSDEPVYAERRHHDAPPGVEIGQIPADRTLSICWTLAISTR